MNRARAGVPEGAEQGAVRSPGWPPGQALQRRAAPSGTPALWVGPQKGPTRRCDASPGPNPGCASRLDWALSGAPRGRDSYLHKLSGRGRGDALLELGPAVVDLALQRRDVVVAEVAVAALKLQVVGHRPGAPAVVEGVAPPVLDLVQRPRARVDRAARDRDRTVVGQPPAVQARDQQRDEAQPAHRLRLLDLALQVREVGHARGGDIGHAVRGHDLRQVLLARGLARRGRAGVGEVRRRRRLLRTGVHVAFVVEAAVDDVLVALGRRRQALDADVVGAAVAGEDDHVRLPAALRIERTPQSRRRRGGGFERGLVHRHAQRTHGLRPADHRHARRRHDRDRVGAERVEDVARGQRLGAAGAGRVARTHERGRRLRGRHRDRRLHRLHLTHCDSGTGVCPSASRTIAHIASTGTLTPPTPASRPWTAGAPSMPYSAARSSWCSTPPAPGEWLRSSTTTSRTPARAARSVRTGSGRNNLSLSRPTSSPCARNASTASRAVPNWLPMVTIIARAARSVRTGSGRNNLSLSRPTSSPCARNASTASRAVPHWLPMVTIIARALAAVAFDHAPAAPG